MFEFMLCFHHVLRCRSEEDAGVKEKQPKGTLKGILLHIHCLFLACVVPKQNMIGHVLITRPCLYGWEELYVAVRVL